MLMKTPKLTGIYQKQVLLQLSQQGNTDATPGLDLPDELGK